MTVKELIEELSRQDPDATVRLSVSNPKDSASTDDVPGVVVGDAGEVIISGWVASDNEGAWMPGA